MGQSHTYNGDGSRFSRTDATGTNSYLWNNQILEAQLGAGNTISTWYTQGMGQYGDIISKRDAAAGASSLQLYDASGNVNQTTDANASITATLSYDTFGSLTDNSGTANPTVAWQGKQGYQFEQALGLQYIRQRWYDPATRQFISQDPLGFGAGDVNLFRYAGNNPVNRNDPGGEDMIDDLTALPGAPLPPVPPAPLTPRQPTHPILRRDFIAGHGGTSALPFENLFRPMPQIHGLGPIEATMNPLASHFDPRPYEISSSGVSAGLAIAVQIHNQDVRMALAGQLDPNMIEGPWGYRFVNLTTEREPGSGAYLGTGLMIYGAPLAIAAGGAVRVAWSVANVTVGTVQAVSGTVHGMRELAHHHIAAGLINLAGAGLGIFVAHGGLRGMGAPTWSETVAGLNVAENSPSLIHLTDETGYAGITTDNAIIGRNGIFAIPESVTDSSALAKMARTGLFPSARVADAVPIPDAATSLFSRPLPIGPYSLLKYASGVRFAPPGSLDITTGAFTPLPSLFGPRTLIYGPDIFIYGMTAGAGATYYYYGGQGRNR